MRHLAREANVISGRLATNNIAERESVFFYPLPISSTWRDVCSGLKRSDHQRHIFIIATTLQNCRREWLLSSASALNPPHCYSRLSQCHLAYRTRTISLLNSQHSPSLYSYIFKNLFASTSSSLSVISITFKSFHSKLLFQVFKKSYHNPCSGFPNSVMKFSMYTHKSLYKLLCLILSLSLSVCVSLFLYVSVCVCLYLSLATYSSHTLLFALIKCC